MMDPPITIPSPRPFERAYFKHSTSPIFRTSISLINLVASTSNTIDSQSSTDKQIHGDMQHLMHLLQDKGRAPQVSLSFRWMEQYITGTRMGDSRTKPCPNFRRRQCVKARRRSGVLLLLGLEVCTIDRFGALKLTILSAYNMQRPRELVVQ